MRTTRFLAPAVLTIAVLGACGDDAGSSSKETPSAWVGRVGPLCDSGDPGFMQFYADHQNPTAADYAAFLATPLAGVKKTADCFKDNPPPAELKDEYDEAMTAIAVVVDDLAQALAAAKDDDLDKVNIYVGKNHDTDIPALEAAFEKVKAAAGNTSA